MGYPRGEVGQDLLAELQKSVHDLQEALEDMSLKTLSSVKVFVVAGGNHVNPPRPSTLEQGSLILWRSHG